MKFLRAFSLILFGLYFSVPKSVYCDAQEFRYIFKPWEFTRYYCQSIRLSIDYTCFRFPISLWIIDYTTALFCDISDKDRFRINRRIQNRNDIYNGVKFRGLVPVVTDVYEFNNLGKLINPKIKVPFWLPVFPHGAISFGDSWGTPKCYNGFENNDSIRFVEKEFQTVKSRRHFVIMDSVLPILIDKNMKSWRWRFFTFDFNKKKVAFSFCFSIISESADKRLIVEMQSHLLKNGQSAQPEEH